MIPNKKATSSSSSVAFNEGLSPVAYLGSYFYGMLQKGHASDGRQGWRIDDGLCLTIFGKHLLIKQAKSVACLGTHSLTRLLMTLMLFLETYGRKRLLYDQKSISTQLACCSFITFSNVKRTNGFWNFLTCVWSGHANVANWGKRRLGKGGRPGDNLTSRDGLVKHL